jgi:uroporphyrinogen-III synthase
VTQSPNRIWLLRSSEGTDDPYESCFLRAGFEASSHPVLAFDDVNDVQLDDALKHPERFSGVILTSPRASCRFLARMSADAALKWAQRPVYAVGERTARDVANGGFPIRGQDSGTGSILAQCIADTHADSRPLLFLAGNRRRPELVDRLAAESIDITEITVYVTHVIELGEPSPVPDWLALFSPSGIEAISSWQSVSRTRIAAIGKTTAAALAEAGFRVDAVSEEPSPTALRDAVLQAV